MVCKEEQLSNDEEWLRCSYWVCKTFISWIFGRVFCGCNATEAFVKSEVRNEGSNMGRISQFTLHCSLRRTSYLKVWKASYIMSGYIELVHINKFNIHSPVHLMYISIGKNNQGRHGSTYSFRNGSSSFNNCFTSLTVAKLGLIPSLCPFYWNRHHLAMEYQGKTPLAVKISQLGTRIRCKPQLDYLSPTIPYCLCHCELLVQSPFINQLTACRPLTTDEATLPLAL